MIGQDLDTDFTYTLTENGVTSAPADVTLDLSAHAPIVNNSTFTASPTTPLTLDPRFNDSDPVGDPLTVQFGGLDDGQNLIPDGSGGYSIPTAPSDGYLFVINLREPGADSETWQVSYQLNGVSSSGPIEMAADDTSTLATQLQQDLNTTLGAGTVSVTENSLRSDLDWFGVTAEQLFITGLPAGDTLTFQASPEGPPTSEVASASFVGDRGHLNPNADGTWTFAPNYDYYSVWGNYEVGLEYNAVDSQGYESLEPADVTLQVKDTAPTLVAPPRAVLSGNNTVAEFPIDATDTDNQPLYVQYQAGVNDAQGSLTFGNEDNGSTQVIDGVIPVTIENPDTTLYYFVSDGFERSAIVSTFIVPEGVTFTGSSGSVPAVDEDVPILIPVSESQATTDWAMTGQLVNDGMNQATTETYGSVNVNLAQGDVSLSEPLEADAQPIGSSSAYSLIYDSSIAQPDPILRATINSDGAATTITGMTVTMQWYSYSPQSDGTNDWDEISGAAYTK